MPILENIPTVPLLLLSGLALTAVVMLGFGGSILFDNYRGRALPAQFLADVEARLAGARERLADILAQIAQSEPQRLEVEKLKYLKEALDDDIRSLEARLSGMDAVRSELAQLETQIGDLLAQRALADEGLLAKKGEVAEAEARLEAAERRTIALETVCAELEARRDTAIAKLSELTPKLDAAERQITEAQRLIDAARAAEAAKAQLEKQIAGLKIDHEQLRQDIARLEADRDGMQDTLAEAKAALASSRERARTLEVETTQTEVRLETARARQDAAENEARTAEAAARVRSDEIAALGAALAPLRAERDGIADAIMTARATLAALDEKARDQRGALSAEGAGSDTVLADLVGAPAFLRETAWKAPLQARQETEALDAAARHIERVGLRFGRRVIRQFHTSLKINDVSQLTVLAGVSGTGKSQLPQRYAEAMGIHFLMVPVQPRWDSPQELLGFYNYIEQRYRATEFARALVHFDPFNWNQEAEPWSDRLLIVLLDEMNLARVEYYFSEFLSRLEKRPPGNLDDSDRASRTDAEIVVDVPKIAIAATPRIYPSERLLFVGTMNEDESTQSLSDKVLDRANLMRFPPPPALVQTTRSGDSAPTGGFLSARSWGSWKRTAESLSSAELTTVGEIVQTINGHCGRLTRAFGHRTSQAIAAYVANYPRDGRETDWRTALADQLELRILPRLRGVEADAARPELEALRALADNQLGDPALAEAIGRSLESAVDAGGLFVWQGVAREG